MGGLDCTGCETSTAWGTPPYFHTTTLEGGAILTRGDTGGDIPPTFGTKRGAGAGLDELELPACRHFCRLSCMSCSSSRLDLSGTGASRHSEAVAAFLAALPNEPGSCQWLWTLGRLGNVAKEIVVQAGTGETLFAIETGHACTPCSAKPCVVGETPPFSLASVPALVPATLLSYALRRASSNFVILSS